MIRFFHTRGHAYTLKKVRKSSLAPAIHLMNYDVLFRARSLSRATHVFADLDRLSYFDLELAAEMYQQLKAAGTPVLNDPARFKNRHSLLRALHAAGLNDFNAYRPAELANIQRFPVFLRRIQGHRAPLTGLLETREAAEKALTDAIASGVPEENLLLIEALIEPVRPGLFRKLAAFRIGNAIVPQLPVHDTHWLVKYGQPVPGIEDLYVQEHAEIQINPHAAHMQKVFAVAGIDYGRADFAFYQGRIQVFEINTNPHMSPGHKHDSATRMASMKLCWQKYTTALHAIDIPRGPRVRLANGKLQSARPWKNLLVRTRKVQ